MSEAIDTLMAQHHAQRVADCQALFTECLRRYKEQRDALPPEKRYSDKKVIHMALVTLVKNGYNKREVMDAMA